MTFGTRVTRPFAQNAGRRNRSLWFSVVLPPPTPAPTESMSCQSPHSDHECIRAPINSFTQFQAIPAHHPPKSCAVNGQKVRSKTFFAAHLFVHCFTCRNHYRSYHLILQNAVVTNRMKACCIFYYFIFTRKKNRRD